MKITEVLIGLILLFTLLNCRGQANEKEVSRKRLPELENRHNDEAQDQHRYLIFLHNRFLETHPPEEAHPSYGRVHYHEIVSHFTQNGFHVISEIRQGNVNALDYAETVIVKIDSLLETGLPPNHITVVGTSKGGYIAQYVSTLLNNPEVNYVFVASFQQSDLETIPEIDFCGNILTIYDTSDPYGTSALARKERSTCDGGYFAEVELATGLGHGFLFRPLAEWLGPTVKWARGNYALK